MRRKLAAGNWKMNGTSQDLAELTALIAAHPAPEVDMLICPPATLLSRAAQTAKGSALRIGAQDCHAVASGAHTGDISAAMLADAGARYVITGHSERRTDHGETDADVRAKSQAAQAAGLCAILCIGESLEARTTGQTLDTISRQLEGSLPDSAEDLVIAYEPIWAIGTGQVATLDQIGEVHGAIRAHLLARYGDAGRAIRLLYGGSVKAANAADIFAVADVDGALVGGASLKAADFAPVVAALAAA